MDGLALTHRFAGCGRWHQRPQKNVIVGAIAYKPPQGSRRLSSHNRTDSRMSPAPPASNAMVSAAVTEEGVMTNGTILVLLTRAGA